MPVPVPDPTLTPEGMIQRASAMVPILRERQEACEAAGRILDSTNDDFIQAGFYRTLQPRRFGGYEFDMPTFVRTMSEISRGCPSSGWVLALTAGHAHTISAFWPEETQVEVFGQTGEYRAPLVGGASATATPVDGGYRLNGFWAYSSGCDIATHFIGSASTPSSGGDVAPQQLMVLIKRTDYTILDDWDVLGMRGTGSRRVIVDDLFVPNNHVIRSARDEEGARTAPGRRVHSNPMYCAGRMASVLLIEMAAVAVGVAKGALDVYEEDLAGKKSGLPPFALRRELPDFQRHYGEVFGMIDLAEAALIRAAQQYMECCRLEVELGEPFSDKRDRRLQLLEQNITHLAAEAVDILWRSAGTSSARTGGRLLRYFRDMSVLRTHIAAQFENGYTAYARAHFGLPLTGP